MNYIKISLHMLGYGEWYRQSYNKVTNIWKQNQTLAPTSKDTKRPPNDQGDDRQKEVQQT